MTAQTELRPDIEIGRKPGSNKISREPGGTRKPHRVLWLIVLLIAMAVAGVVGVAVAAHVTDPRRPPGSSTRSRTPTPAKAASPRPSSRTPTSAKAVCPPPPPRSPTPTTARVAFPTTAERLSLPAGRPADRCARTEPAHLRLAVGFQDLVSTACTGPVHELRMRTEPSQMRRGAPTPASPRHGETGVCPCQLARRRDLNPRRLSPYTLSRSADRCPSWYASSRPRAKCGDTVRGEHR